ncbi:hypothetical protein [Vagococcus carniphilus]|uniref:hypothetical protein n=1 Tax=Vagococcus carniphilus TaxID=218144 RepID=UPI003B5A98AF
MILLIILLISGLFCLEIFKFVKSYYYIDSYIQQQGIKKEDIIASQFFKSFKTGNYERCIVVKEEKDKNIFYDYRSYHNEVDFYSMETYTERFNRILSGEKNLWEGIELSNEKEKQIAYPRLQNHQKK